MILIFRLWLTSQNKNDGKAPCHERANATEKLPGKKESHQSSFTIIIGYIVWWFQITKITALLKDLKASPNIKLII